MKWISPVLMAALVPVATAHGQSDLRPAAGNAAAPGPVVGTILSQSSDGEFRPGTTNVPSEIESLAPGPVNALPGSGQSGNALPKPDPGSGTRNSAIPQLPVNPLPGSAGGSGPSSAATASIITEPCNDDCGGGCSDGCDGDCGSEVPCEPPAKKSWKDIFRRKPPQQARSSRRHTVTPQQRVVVDVPADDCDQCAASDSIINTTSWETVETSSRGCDCGQCQSVAVGGYDEGVYLETGEESFAEIRRTRSSRRGHRHHGHRHVAYHQSPPHDYDYADEGYIHGERFGEGNIFVDDQPQTAYQHAVEADRQRLESPDDQINTLIGVSGLYFSRNYDDRVLSVNNANPAITLSTDDADHEHFSGVDAVITRRRATGKGYEFRYFGFFPGEATAQIAGPATTLLSPVGLGPGAGLSTIGQAGGLTAEQAFNLGDLHEITRDTEILNAEFNILRMGRQARTHRGQEASYEYLLGFRYFKFDESLNYSAQNIRPNLFPGGDIQQADYFTSVENDLYGIQIGGRSELGFLRRFRFLVGAKAGIFNNQFSGQQRATFVESNGAVVTNTVLATNQPFDVEGSDSDFSLLAELDLGVTMQLTQRSRVRAGYRAVFVSDVALADEQIERDFFDLAAVSQVEADRNLVLYGGYLGMEFAF